MKFSAKEILETAAIFRNVPPDFRGLVTGMMIGATIINDEQSMPEMVGLARSIQKQKEGVS